MDMHKAALPPQHGPVTAEDRRHPRYPEYSRHRAAMAALLVEAPGFKDWLRQSEAEAVRDEWAKHPRYPEFLAWMRKTKGGARRCPAGLFPDNFKHWLEGGRW